MTRPTMYVIAGPNGAGKSTLYRDVIAPRVSATFINADLIQRDELANPSMAASYKAAEIAESRRQDYLKQGLSFVTESTFSHPSKLDLIEDAQQAGFRVVLYHVNVRSPELSIHRVAARVKEGGHDVPEDKIRERYARNGALIRRAAMRADYAFVYDNSMLNQAPALALAMRAGQVFEASDRVPAWARELYAHELSGLSPSRLNPGAASFDEGKQIVAKLGGPDATLSVPAIRKGSGYGGQIIGETSLHYIQQIDSSRYIAHFKSAFPQPLALSRDYLVTYAGRGQAVAETARTIPSMGHDATVPVEMARRLLGPQTLITQNINSGVFRGVIVGETEHHFVQRISSKLAAIHEKARMPSGLQVGDAGTLRYRGGKAGFEPMKEIERGRGGLTR